MSDRVGTAQFYVCEHSGWHSLIKDFPNAPISKTISVPTTTLDKLLIDHSLTREGAVRIVKVDVDGAEILVLSGALKTIALHCIALG